MTVVLLWLCLIWVSHSNGESCRKRGMYGEITPADLSYVYFGDNFTMTCDVTNYTSNILNGHLVLRGPAGESHLVSETSGPLRTTVWDVISASYRNGSNWAHYVCLYKNKTDECLLADRYIRVDHRPRLPRDGRCVVDNWTSMKCTWDLEVTYRKVVNVSIQYEQLNGTLKYSFDTRSWSHCPKKQLDGNLLTCSFSRVSLGTYFFLLKIWNDRHRSGIDTDLKMTNFTVITDNIVKPAKVDSFKADVNSTNIRLWWKHGKSNHPMLFRIRYHSKWDNMSFWKERNTTGYGLVLKDMKPSTRYSLRLSCIPVHGNTPNGYWSDATTLDIETLEDVPSAVPTVYPGFFSCVTENCTRVVFYWKHIADEQKNGEIQNHRITVATKATEYSDPYNTTKYDKIGRNDYSYEVAMDSDRFASIGFSQATRVGYPQDDKILRLVPFIQRPPAPAYVKVEVLTQTKVKVKWKAVPSDVNRGYYKRLITYTVVWCESSHKTRFVCEREIRAHVSLVRNCTTDVCSWDLDLPRSYERYMIGVSVEAETDSGHFQSSGIKWSTCTYNTRSELNPLTAELGLQEDPRTVGLSWKHEGCGPEPTGYIIVYCEANGEKECKDETTTEIPVNKTVSSYMLTGLTEGMTYNIWVIGEYGKGGTVTKKEVKFYPVPKGVDPNSTYTDIVSSGLRPEVIAPVCIVVAVLAGVGVFLCIKFRRYIHSADEETRDIDIPRIKSNGAPRPKPGQLDSYVVNSTERAEDEPLLNKLPRPEINSGGSGSKSGETDLSRMYYSTSPDQLHSKSDHTYITSSEKRDSGYISPVCANRMLNDGNMLHDQNSLVHEDGGSSAIGSNGKSEGAIVRAPDVSMAGGQRSDSSVEQYVRQKCATNWNSEDKLEHSHQNSRENDHFSAEQVHNHNESNSANSLGEQGINMTSTNLNSSKSAESSSATGSIASYAKATQDTSNVNISSSDLDNTYISQAGHVNSGTSVSPYVTQADLDKLENPHSLKSSNPYLPHTAVSSVDNFTNPRHSTMPCESSADYISNSQIPNTHSRESVTPYVQEMMNCSAVNINSGETADTYVQQALDTSVNNVDSAGSVVSYVQQTLVSSAGNIDSVGGVDPDAEHTMDASAGSVDSSGSVEPYVQQMLDRSSNHLTSAGSVDSYVTHIPDTSATNLNSCESIDPYVTHTRDTSAGTISSSSSFDPYVQHSGTPSGLISNSENGSGNPMTYETEENSGINSSSSGTLYDPYISHSRMETMHPHAESNTDYIPRDSPASDLPSLNQQEDNSLTRQSNPDSTWSTQGSSNDPVDVMSRSNRVLDQENFSLNRADQSSSSGLRSRNPDESADTETGDCCEDKVQESGDNVIDDEEGTDGGQTVIIPISQVPAYSQNYHQTFQTLSNGYVRPIV